ncbi:lipoprotein-releasing ABC transporter permease subunit LolE [Vibrio sp. SS-MA-C1-2]|uniref:lipoprotein-releasing ABC transporter permease subunit LolE n=1 Tax=Vibrio sp. SS-MA-C1-2 TaxID=2908646 RepID=UPI001F2F3EF4|nr:lipoprotein-releasing ABC transporter permease subunit LolE [Vibrio sp. SS-MA-C1-2]UJF17430.1 lipoprotein-releasing ABC transporter permease subunit LolE [Vibrio sp. SS-MA-C1-2]
MFKPLSLFIALRFGRGKQRNKMVSFISISSIIGIALGVCVVIIGLSAMNGFEKELKDRVLSVVPQAELEAVKAPMDNWQQLITKVEKHPEVEAASPYVQFVALVERRGKLKAIQVRGVDLQGETEVSSVPSFVLNHRWQTLEPNQHQIVIGKGIADLLAVKEGDWITLMIPSKNSANRLKAPKRIRVQVSGILSLGGQIDHGLGLIPIQDAQQYLDYGAGISGLTLKVSDPLDAQSIVREVGNTLPVYVYLKSWMGKFGYLYRDIQLIRTIMYLVMVLVIGVACFNVVSTLMMAVKDRSSDIAILRTMGVESRTIRTIFIFQGLLSGIVGSLTGSIVGCLVALNLTSIIGLIEKLIGHQFLSGDIYFIDFLPSLLMWQDVAIVSITAIVLSLLATWYPANRAAKLQPARVLSAK